MNAETVANDPWEDLAGPSTRTPRSLETRERDTRKREWQQPTMLPDPEPQDGYVFKWVRLSSYGHDDHLNYQKRLREGWEPVRAEDHPELMVDVGIERKHGLAESGGLVLCKMPQEMVEQRTRFYQNRTTQILRDAEDSYMRDEDERMKKFNESRRKAVFGR